MIVELSFLPPSDVVEQADIKHALSEYEAAAHGARDADRALTQLQRSRGQAERDDAEATADAIAKRKADPGPKHVSKYEQQLADAQRQAAARQVVRARAQRAVVEAFERHGEALREQVERDFEQLRADYLSALDALIEAHRALSAGFKLHAFCANDNGTARFRPGAVYAAVDQIPVPRLQDDTQLLLADVFERLVRVGAPPSAPRTLTQALAAAREAGDPVGSTRYHD
jgi:hypothetical protein